MQRRLKDVIKTQATDMSPKTLRNRNKPVNKLKIVTGEFLISKHLMIPIVANTVCVRGGLVKSKSVVDIQICRLYHLS